MKMKETVTTHEVYSLILPNVGTIRQFWSWVINRQL